MNEIDKETLRKLMLVTVEATQGIRQEVNEVIRKLLVDKINELQEKVDTLEKGHDQVWNAAILQAMYVAEGNRYNSNGATMTIDSLRVLLK